MSTQALVIVQGPVPHGVLNSPDEVITLRFSKRSDGMPSTVLEELRDTVKESESVLENKKAVLSAEVFVGKLLGVGTDEHGMSYSPIFQGKNGNFSYRRDGKFSPQYEDKKWGWTYLVDCVDKTINIYFDDFDDVKDPYDYLENILPNYKQGVEQQIRDAIISLAELGWKVNQMTNAEKFIRKL